MPPADYNINLLGSKSKDYGFLVSRATTQNKLKLARGLHLVARIKYVVDQEQKAVQDKIVKTLLTIVVKKNVMNVTVHE